MQIEKRTLNWLPKPSAFDYQQSLNARRTAQAQAYMNDTSLVAPGLFSISTTQAEGMATIAANAAMARINKSA